MNRECRSPFDWNTLKSWINIPGSKIGELIFLDERKRAAAACVGSEERRQIFRSRVEIQKERELRGRDEYIHIYIYIYHIYIFIYYTGFICWCHFICCCLVSIIIVIITMSSWSVADDESMLRMLVQGYVKCLPEKSSENAMNIARKIYSLTRYTLHGVTPEEDDSDSYGSGYGKSTETMTFVVPKDLRANNKAAFGLTPSTEGKADENNKRGFGRRNRPGTKAKDMYAFDDTCDANNLKSLRERLAHLIRIDPSNVIQICALPVGADKTRWIYELLRRFVIELHDLVICLREKMDCTSTICPTMSATEKYTFRCAGINGGSPFQCCAIEYMTHTLDSATNTLTSGKLFPINDRAVISRSSLSPCSSQCRRLYRLFPHAYFHHRETFMKFESKHHLFKRFVHFVREFRLVSERQLVPRIGLS